MDSESPFQTRSAVVGEPPAGDFSLAREGLRIAAIAWTVELIWMLVRQIIYLLVPVALEKSGMSFARVNVFMQAMMTVSVVLFTGTSIVLAIGFSRIKLASVAGAARAAMVCFLLEPVLSIVFRFLWTPSEAVSMLSVVVDTAGALLALLVCDRLSRIAGRPLPQGARTALLFLLAWGVVFSFGQRILELRAFTRIGEPLGTILSMVEWGARYALFIWIARTTARALEAGTTTANLDFDASLGAPASNTAISNMVIGGVMCIIGIAVTAATYSAASNGGGQYVVAWGAILYGAIRFFRGLAGYTNKG